MLHKCLVAVIAIGVTSCLANDAHAWNKSGHMTSAAIAYDDLMARSPATAEQVVAILRRHPQYDQRWRSEVEATKLSKDESNRRLFMLAARWPDDVRGDHNFDRPKDHFINLPYKPPDQPNTVKVSQPAAEHLVAAHAEHIATMRSAAADEERAIALCWIFHLTGDVHQPLHSVTLFSTQYNSASGDRGGTRFYIRATGGSSTLSLHALWDNLVIGSVRFKSVANRATALRSKPGLGREDLQELTKRPFKVGSVMKWAIEESLVLAQQEAYLDGHLKGSSNKVAGEPLPANYVGNAKRVAEKQMALAGYRLSDILQSVLP
jgi:hypothetical protein